MRTSNDICAKRTHQNSANTKIVDDEIIFVRGKATKAQHSKPM